MPVYNKNGEIINAKILSQQLQQIANSEKEFGLPLGLLSTDSRDNWAAAYAELMKSSTNAKSIKIIQQSLFTVSLDEIIPFSKDNVYNVLGLQLIHGGGTSKNSANRWMDKTIQVNDIKKRNKINLSIFLPYQGCSQSKWYEWFLL